MGTDTHKPGAHRANDPFQTGHAHDDAKRAAGPGVRPGTRSRILEARERRNQH